MLSSFASRASVASYRQTTGSCFAAARPVAAAVDRGFSSSAPKSLPRPVRLLMRHGAEALKPTSFVTKGGRKKWINAVSCKGGVRLPYASSVYRAVLPAGWRASCGKQRSARSPSLRLCSHTLSIPIMPYLPPPHTHTPLHTYAHTQAVNPRHANKVRKAAIIDGTFGSFDASTGLGWDPAWDKEGRLPWLRQPKLKKRQRNREARATKIENNLEQVPKKIADHRAKLELKKPKTGIIAMIKRINLKKTSRSPKSKDQGQRRSSRLRPRRGPTKDVKLPPGTFIDHNY